MQEKRIEYELAILLKRKGFDWHTDMYYGESKDLVQGGYTNYNVNKSQSVYSAPTLSHVQKWFREIHSIHIVPLLESYSGDYGIEILINGKAPTRFYNIGNYEDALKEGIFQTLKLR